MTKRRFGESSSPSSTWYPNQIVHPGVARTHRVTGPMRDAHIRAGTYRPSNRWRSSQGSGRQILQRAQNLAHLLPWNTHYNFARS